MIHKKDSNRESNIELLRIIAIMGVIILHYNNFGLGGGITLVKENSINQYVLYYLESLFVCAVDLFMIVSGYFLCFSNRRTLTKPFKLLFQVCFYKSILCAGAFIISQTWSLKMFVARVIPNDYFVILYIVVYLITPYVNILLNELSEHRLNKMILLLFCIFSIWPTLVDLLSEICGWQWIGLSSIGMYGSQWGYTLINFLFMYIIGAWIRLYGKSIFSRNIFVYTWIGILVIPVFLTIWAKFNEYTGFFTERSAWEYCNPLVILEAVLIFIFFKSKNFGCNRFINLLSQEVFSVYLLMNVMIVRLNVEFYVNSNIFVMLMHIFFSVIAIYTVCWFWGWLYNKIFSILFGKIKKK